MKLVINRDLLIRAMSLVIEVSDSRHRLPVLRNLKLVLEQNYLTLTASDLEVELTNQIALPEGVCVEAGEMTLPADKFFGICKLLPEEMVVIEADLSNQRCYIGSGKGRYSLSTLPASDFPSIGEVSEQNTVKIGLGALATLIRHTRFAMATQDVRHYLTGLLVELNGQEMTAVATDGHRLAVAHRVLEESYPQGKLIIPGKAVGGLERLLTELAKVSDEGGMVSLSFSEEFLYVTLNFANEMMVNLTARLIEGKFPDYRRVLPVGHDKIAIFHKDDMVSVLRRVAILNTKDSPGVLLTFGEQDSAQVSSNNREQDEATESLAVKFSGEPIEISFNESYLRAVLNVLEGDVRLEMVHPTSPTLIYQVGDEHAHQYIVMPMRV